VRTFTVRPEDFGLPRVSMRDLLGGDREQNAAIIHAILRGEPGPKRDIVVMNAAAALVVGVKARDLKEGVELAARSIDTGAARDKLEELVRFTGRLSQEAERGREHSGRGERPVPKNAPGLRKASRLT